MSSQEKKKSFPRIDEQRNARRDFFRHSLSRLAVFSLGYTLYPLQSAATIFNIGSFWRKRTVAGTLWAWGQNVMGELGDGTQVKKSSPVQIGSLTNWSQIASGYYHTIALKNNGTLWAWGDGSAGSLGHGSATNRSSPIQIGALTNWVQVSAGHGGHSAGVRADGTMWCWGVNNFGQLGDGSIIGKSSPVQVGALTDWAYVDCGGYFTVGMKRDGTIWSWGKNSYGALGQNNAVASISSPVQIGALTNWASLSVGYEHVLALKKDGSLWSWGYNFNGQLGNNSLTNVSSPVQVGALTDWAKISAGVYHSGAIKKNGTLWMWGSGWAGQLGNGMTNTFSSPIQIGALTTWSQVSAAYENTLGLRSDGTLWVWGDDTGAGNVGALGLGTSATSRSSPTQIGSLTTWTQLGIGSKLFAIRAN